MGTAINRVLRVLAWGGLVIYLVLVLSFRDFIKPFRVLGPTIAAVIVVSAVFVFNGIYLTLFHFVSLLLVIGLGLDYSLFFNRLTDDDAEWGTTFRALWICCLTTVLVFGALLFSSTPPLRAIGQTVGLGAGFCLIFGAIWSSNEKNHFRRGRWRKVLQNRKIRPQTATDDG